MARRKVRERSIRTLLRLCAQTATYKKSSKGFTKNTVVVYDVTGDGDTGKRPIIVFPRGQRKCRAVRA